MSESATVRGICPAEEDWRDVTPSPGLAFALLATLPFVGAFEPFGSACGVAVVASPLAAGGNCGTVTGDALAVALTSVGAKRSHPVCNATTAAMATPTNAPARPINVATRARGRDARAVGRAGIDPLATR